MHDLVIRGGTVVDGTGTEKRTADVAIDGDRIVAVGGEVGEGVGQAVAATTMTMGEVEEAMVQSDDHWLSHLAAPEVPHHTEALS